MPRLSRLGFALPLLALLAAGPVRADEPLRFGLTVGHHENLFFREGPVSAHLVLGGGRIVIALPAGNSGIGLWSDEAGKTTAMHLAEPLAPLTISDGQGRPLHGITGVVEIAAPRFTITTAILSNIRVLRDFALTGKREPLVETPPVPDGTEVRWHRDRLDGAPGFALTLAPLNGTATVNPDSTVTLTSRDGGALRLRIAAAGGETPLTPIRAADLLKDSAQPDATARNVLEFLSYREKLMAGSWTFNTYFGRDTLMSLRLLLPVLKPAALEAGLGAVLERLNPAGEVAHEEDIGEFAVLRHRREDKTDSAAPILDYKMVDDDFMLAPVLADYLLSPDLGPRAAQEFLMRRTPDGTAYGALLVRNLGFVLDRAAAFARDPVPTHLVALQDGARVGDWRDSEDGLADGRYAYSVNAVLVPAALTAADRLYRSGLLAPYGTTGLDRADGMARVWRNRAPSLFGVTIPAAQAATAIRTFAAEMGVDSPTPPAGPLHFDALSLDGQGRPIPVMHSDIGFALLFLDPPAADLDRMIDSSFRRFPAGLITDVGVVVANAAFADKPIRDRFGKGAYHGAVIWSWQQALLAAGLDRQLARRDLPTATRARLEKARRDLWKLIQAVGPELRSSELWSWRFADGQYQFRPLGQGSVVEVEANAAQLWSTVYLGLTPATN